jgi:hypothetical protein
MEQTTETPPPAASPVQPLQYHRQFDPAPDMWKYAYWSLLLGLFVFLPFLSAILSISIGIEVLKCRPRNQHQTVMVIVGWIFAALNLLFWGAALVWPAVQAFR